MFQKILMFLMIGTITFPGIAQNQFRSWGSASMNLALAKRIDFHLNYLKSYNLSDNFTNNFNQSSASLSYGITKRFSALGGAMIISFPFANDPTYRYFARVAYKLPMWHVITWSNSLQAEQHSASETRFSNRIIYITRVSNKKRIDFLHLTLSASYWLYYNMGGSEIRYFEKDGTVLARNAPDGLHRGRLYLAASSKVNRNFSVSIYYMHQQEFNLFSNELRRINITNPSTGKISRAFDNYNVAGISLLGNIRLYKNHRNSLEPTHKKLKHEKYY